MLGMSVRGFASLVATTALLGAVCGAAHAAPVSAGVAAATASTAAKPIDFTVHSDASPAAPGAQTLKLDAAKNRWGLTFSVNQPDTRQTTLNDIQAGAYYKITPTPSASAATFAFDAEPVVSGAQAQHTGSRPAARSTRDEV